MKDHCVERIVVGGLFQALKNVVQRFDDFAEQTSAFVCFCIAALQFDMRDRQLFGSLFRRRIRVGWSLSENRGRRAEQQDERS